MPLEWLSLGNTPVDDLTPLKGMPLETLMLSNTRVEDLSPLEGMPLKQLWLRGTPAAEKPLPDWLNELKKKGCSVIL